MPREATEDTNRDINTVPREAKEDAKRGDGSCNERH